MAKRPYAFALGDLPSVLFARDREGERAGREKSALSNCKVLSFLRRRVAIL